MNIKKLLVGLVALLALAAPLSPANAQLGPSTNGPMYNPNWYKGYVPTQLEWALLWSNKADYFSGGTPIIYGGTGATNAAQARANLGIPNVPGTVTSVGMTVPSILSVSPATITTTGTFALSLATQSANRVFAGPATGVASAPTFRALVAADLPGTYANSVSNIDGTLTISPTTGAVVASLALGHANTWSGQQTFVAPILGAATGTSLALGGATIGTNALAVTGTSSFGGNIVSDLLFTDATYDIGKIGATRPRNGYFSGNIIGGNNITAGSAFVFPGATTMFSTGDGLLTFSKASQVVGALIDVSTDATVKFRNRANSADAAITASTLALGGATIGSDALGVTGTATISGQFFTGLGSAGAPALALTGTPTSGIYWRNVSAMNLAMGGVNRMEFGISGDISVGGSTAGLYMNGTNAATASDAIIRRRSAANIVFGAVDAAAPVAQTISVQNVATGTTNTAGANFTLAGSQGTGTGVGGSLLFQVAPAGSTGSMQNALATALTIDSTKLATFGAGITSPGQATIASMQFGATTQMGSGGVDGLLLIRNNAGTAGASINVATDATAKFFARDGTTQAAVQAGTLALGGATISGTVLAAIGTTAVAGAATGNATGEMRVYGGLSNSGYLSLSQNSATDTGRVLMSYAGSTLILGGGNTTGLTLTSALITAALPMGGTSLALGGATIGSNALAVAGTVAFTSFTAGSIPYIGASGVLTQNPTALVWDAANSRLGIGTSTPSTKLDVVTGSAGLSGGARFNSGGNATTGGIYIRGEPNGTTQYNFLIGAQVNINNGFEITPSSAAAGTTFSTPAFTIAGATGAVGVPISLAVGGATIGTNALAVTGTTSLGLTQLTGIGINTAPSTNPQLRVQGIGTGANYPLYITDSVPNVIISAQDNGSISFGGGAGGTIATFTNTTKAVAFPGTLALGGATIGTNALAVTGTTLHTGNVQFSNGSTLFGASFNNRLDLDTAASQMKFYTSGGPTGFVLDMGTNSTMKVFALNGSTAGNVAASTIYNASASRLYLGAQSTTNFFSINNWVSAGNLSARAGGIFGWVSSTTDPDATAPDTILARGGAANLRLGGIDAAAPVAQTISVQSVATGTTNTSGQNLTISGSQSTGTGNGGQIIFQVSGTGSTGSTQNALSSAVVIDSSKIVTFLGSVRSYTDVYAGSNSSAGAVFGFYSLGYFTSVSDGVWKMTQNNGSTLGSMSIAYTVSTLPAALRGARAYVTDQLTTCAAIGVAPTGGGAVVCPVFYNGSAWVSG